LKKEGAWTNFYYLSYLQIRISFPKEIKEQLDREKLLEALGKDSAKFDKAFTKMKKKKESFALIVGEDLYFHKRAKNIANLIVALENYSPVKVAMFHPKTNSLGWL